MRKHINLMVVSLAIGAMGLLGWFMLSSAKAEQMGDRDSLGEFVIDGIVQGGKEIEPVCDTECVYTLNDLEKYTMRAHFTQATDDALYILRLSDGKNGTVQYSGAELKAGIEHVASGYNGYSAAALDRTYVFVIQNAMSSVNMRHVVDETYYNARITFVEDNTLPRMTSVGLVYADSGQEVVDGIVDVRYHDADKPLGLRVLGQNFDDDEEYEINVLIKRTFSEPTAHDEVFYEQTLLASGKDMNSDGAVIILDGLELEAMSIDNLIADAMMYSMDVTLALNDQVMSSGFDYGYKGVLHLAGSNIFTKNIGGKESLVLTLADSMPLHAVRIGEQVATAHFVVSGLPSDEAFTYEVYRYNYGRGFYENDVSDADLVAQESLTGRQLATGLASVEVECGNTYYFIIKHGNAVVAWNEYSIAFEDDRTAVSVVNTEVRGRTIEVKLDEYTHYNIIKGNDAKISIKAIGVDENEEYGVNVRFDICPGTYFSSTCVQSDVLPGQVKTFTGKELLDGTASFDLMYSEDIYNSLAEDDGIYLTAIISIGDNTTYGQRVYFRYEDKGVFAVKLSSNDETFAHETEVYLSVDDYDNLSEACGGIAGLFGDIVYDTDMLELVSIEGMNGFEVTEGEHLVLHKDDGTCVAAGTNIMKLTFRNKALGRGEGTVVKFANAVGSDSVVDIDTADATITMVRDSGDAEIVETDYTISGDEISEVVNGTAVSSFTESFILNTGATIEVVDADGTVLGQDDKVGTGARVRLIGVYGDVVAEYVVIVKGDMSGDGIVSIIDLVRAKRHLAGLDEYSGVYLKAGDILGTGSITITDVVRICRHVAGIALITE